MTHGTDSHTGDGQVLKIDTKGRVRSTPAQRSAVLEQYDRSGLSGPKFAAVAGVKYQTLVAWRKRRGLERTGGTEAAAQALPGAASPQPVKWMEAVIAPASGQVCGVAAALKIQWQGATLEITEQAQVPLAAALLKTLENPGRGSC